MAACRACTISTRRLSAVSVAGGDRLRTLGSGLLLTLSLGCDPPLRQATQPQHALGRLAIKLRSVGRTNRVGEPSHGESPYRARNVTGWFYCWAERRP